MSDFIVTWTINIDDVDTHEEAARAALEVQRDRTSDATVFMVAKVLEAVPGNRVILEDHDTEVVL